MADKRVPQFIGEGDRMFAMGKHDEAQRSYSIALQLSKNGSSRAFSRRASAHIELKNWQQAHKDASQALDLDATDAEAYTARATALFQNNSFEAAATDFEAALNFAPSDENQENLQRCLRAMQEDEEDIEEEEDPYGGIDDEPEPEGGFEAPPPLPPPAVPAEETETAYGEDDDDYGDVDAPPPRPPASRAAPPPPADESAYGEDESPYGDDDAPPPRPPPAAAQDTAYGEDDDDYGDVDAPPARPPASRAAPPPPADESAYGEDESPYGEDDAYGGGDAAPPQMRPPPVAEDSMYGEDEDDYGAGGMPAGAQAAYPMASASNPPAQQMQQMRVAAPAAAAAKAPAKKPTAAVDDEATLRGKTYGQIVFGHLGRNDAEKQLKAACVGGGAFVDGTFLLRSSSTVLGGLVVSMFYKSKCYHYQFAKDSSGSYVRSDGKVIGSNVVEFIKYYRRRRDGMKSKCERQLMP